MEEREPWVGEDGTTGNSDTLYGALIPQPTSGPVPTLILTPNNVTTVCAGYPQRFGWEVALAIATADKRLVTLTMTAEVAERFIEQLRISVERFRVLPK